MTKVRILIVDDHIENIDALSRLIEGEEVEIFSAVNADGALELVSKHEFGLALLDVQMPNITGFELAKIVRGVKRFKTLPIIFVTAHQESSAVLFEGYQSGAVDLLFKPLNPNIVRAKVKIFVELAQQKMLLQLQVRELERLRVQADSANFAKSQFLANMSHEIRTPLAAVIGFADLLTRDQITREEKEECSSAVKRNGVLLMRLVDDILDLSKIEANKLEPEQTIFDLNELLSDVNTTMSFRAQENGVQLKLQQPSFEKEKFISDSVRIKQALLNIIGNAIKFSPGGSVQVNFSLKPQLIKNSEGAEFQTLFIEVMDTGVGLSAEQIEKLFRPFSQADESTKRQFGGSGLGLVISREIARALGGDIRLASSEIGKGSIFEIEFLLKRADEITLSTEKINKRLPDTATFSVAFLKGRKILAVDDSPDNLKLLSHYLKNSEVQMTFAENGMQAISEVENNKFDLILMDVQMPGMDGHETTAEIRRLNFKNPIIALTAHALKSEHEKCREAGCDDVLTKPVSQVKLLEKIHSFLN